MALGLNQPLTEMSILYYCHPVAVVQYTYTHKQYTERHETNNTWNNTKIRKSAGRALFFVGFTLAFALQLRKKHGKTSVRVAIHTHTIRIHRHNNKNT
jgi:hypothetical protein